MGVEFAAIAPHGFPIIPALSDDAEGGLATRKAMLEFGRRLGHANVDVIVVATPHGVRVDGAVCLADIGCSRERMRAAILHMHEIRRRFSIVDLAWLAGVLPDAADDLIGEWLSGRPG